jgi:GTP-binding protein HflX
LATAALVGYTNAGKSTLFNRLTGSDVLADDRLFATLDPTIRTVVLPSHRRILLSDTVGFIRNLPPTLVEAFRATLEEVTEASLLLHVVDASCPQAPQQAAEVGRVLAELGAGHTPHVLVLNKMDRIPAGEVGADSLFRRIAGEMATPFEGRWVAISALTGQGLDRLLEVIDEALPVDPITAARFRVPAGEGAALHLLHEFGRVFAIHYRDGCCEVEAEVPESLKRKLAGYLSE